jgi:hypothetical protein
MTIRMLIFLGGVVSVGLCTENPFAQFYSPEEFDLELPPRTGTVRVIRTSDAASDANGLIEDGYGVIGSSNFSSAVIPPDHDLLDFAEKIEAEVVLLATEDQQRNVVKPIVTQEAPTVVAFFESGFFNGWHGLRRLSGNYRGGSIGIVPGGKSTQYVPVTEDQHIFHAVFWRKGPPPIFGAQVTSLPSSLRQKLNQNTGVLVTLIINDSPAFRANVLAGDVILACDDWIVESPSAFGQWLAHHAQTQVTMNIWRDNEQVRVVSTLNALPRTSTKARPLGAATEFRRGGRPWKKLSIGMSRRDVRDQLGQPEKITGEDGEQIWGYAGGGEVRFHKHFVSAWSPPRT